MRLILLTLLGLFAGCNSLSQTTIFKNDQYHYEFEYPNDWTIKDLGQSSADVIAPVEHPEEKERETLSVSSETTDGMTLEQCYKKYVSDWYYDQYQGTTVAEGDADINGRKAKWMEYQYGDKASMTTLVYLVHCGDRFFLINTLSSSKQYPKYKERFEGIVKTFKAK